MSKELTGKIAIVTGSSRGIGRQIAIQLATEGAYVVVNYFNNSTAAEEVVQKIQTLGSKSFAIQADVSKVSDIKHLFAETVKVFGGLDIFINNAVHFKASPIVSTTEEEFDKAINTNIRGPFFALQEAAKIIRNNGSIVNISSSLTAANPPPNFSLYLGSKAAMEQISKCAAIELAEKNVNVNTLSPGVTDTEAVSEAIKPNVIARTPFKRLGTTEEIANIAVFLASPKGKWITGQNIKANGGLHMTN